MWPGNVTIACRCKHDVIRARQWATKSSLGLRSYNAVHTPPPSHGRVSRAWPSSPRSSPEQDVLTRGGSGICNLQRRQARGSRRGPVSRHALCRTTAGRSKIPWSSRSNSRDRCTERLKRKSGLITLGSGYHSISRYADHCESLVRSHLHRRGQDRLRHAD